MMNNAQAHRRKVESLARDAEEAAGTLRLIANRLAETLERGGAASIQPQMAFLFGALARMQKDWGVVEHLQAQGAALKSARAEARENVSANGTARQ